VDGDPIGVTPMTFRVLPGALHAWLPPDAAQELIFSASQLRLPAALQTIRHIFINNTQARP